MNAGINTIGERFKKLRKQSGWNQEELGVKLGMTVSNVSSLEKGKSTPTVDTLVKMAMLFSVDLNWLITGNEEADKSGLTYNNSSTSSSHGGTMTGGDQKVNFGAANSDANNEWKDLAAERKEQIIELKEELKKCREKLTTLEEQVK